MSDNILNFFSSIYSNVPLHLNIKCALQALVTNCLARFIKKKAKKKNTLCKTFFRADCARKESQYNHIFIDLTSVIIRNHSKCVDGVMASDISHNEFTAETKTEIVKNMTPQDLAVICAALYYFPRFHRTFNVMSTFIPTE